MTYNVFSGTLNRTQPASAEFDVDPFVFTKPNPTHELIHPTQLNPSHYLHGSTITQPTCRMRAFCWYLRDAKNSGRIKHTKN